MFNPSYLNLTQKKILIINVFIVDLNDFFSTVVNGKSRAVALWIGDRLGDF